jgi:hypothetical protein
MSRDSSGTSKDTKIVLSSPITSAEELIFRFSIVSVELNIFSNSPETIEDPAMVRASKTSIG